MQRLQMDFSAGSSSQPCVKEFGRCICCPDSQEAEEIQAVWLMPSTTKYTFHKKRNTHVNTEEIPAVWLTPTTANTVFILKKNKNILEQEMTSAQNGRREIELAQGSSTTQLKS